MPTLICDLDGVLFDHGPAQAVVLEVLEVLAGLRRRGWLLVAAADTDPRGRCGRTEEGAWALDLFDRVVGADDAGAHRPDPRFFAELVRELPRSGPRLYVDDDPRNVAAARSAGLDAHLFTGAGGLVRACRSALLTPI